MALIVMKYGGSSVADRDRVFRVAGIIADTYCEGNDVVVVLSAQGKTTDGLIAKAKEINPNASKREMDMLLSCGEQMSVALCAMALESMGLPVISLTGWQAGLNTDSNYSNARFKRLSCDRIREELDKRRIVIVTGFQGINKHDDITTLGRGGSDTSAVAIAAAMGADLCQIYTDVDGVYTADPRKVPNAKKLEEITYDEMLELASMGAKVLHNRSVEMAKRYGVNLEVLSSFERKPGTKVKEAAKVEQAKISGVAEDMNVARVAIVGLKDEPGVAFRVFRAMEQNHINVDMILQSIGRNGTKDISFTVQKLNADAAKKVLEGLSAVTENTIIDVNEDVAKISVVGAGIASHGVAAQVFEAMYNAHINLNMIATSEVKISVLVDAAQADRAVIAIHNQFFGD